MLGREMKIFEGDICSYKSLVKRKTGKVFYENGSFKIRLGRWFTSYLDQKQVYSDMGATTEWDLDLEVIGNIHDNPELVGETK